MASSLPPNSGNRGIEERILKLAYQRFLENQELSFLELLISLFQYNPKRIGSHEVTKLSRKQVVDLCRAEPFEDFQFDCEADQEKYRRDKIRVLEAVSELVRRGLITNEKEALLIWIKGQPRVERIQYYDMIRLTKKGETILKGLSQTAPCTP